ncbi:MAG: APC family permease [Phycisphaerales bacterium]|jgi:APA family basic amino acid/polyamine antiporter
MTTPTNELRRVITLPGAVGIGLGSIIGTGAFVTLGLGAGLAGPWLLLAIVIAGALAMCNGLSSAQLAAVHPVSGGTYAYGYRFVHPLAGFAAGWVFLIAKTASCATAALGLGGLIAWATGKPGDGATMTLAALGSLLVVAAMALAGVTRSVRFNFVLLFVTAFALLTMVIAAAPAAWRGWQGLSWSAIADRPISAPGVLETAALSFVAFAGFARIATMGEEVREPRRTIPRAVVITLGVAIVLYALVAFTGLGVLGAAEFGSRAAEDAAPLLAVAKAVEAPTLAIMLGMGAAAALLAVQLNLIMGLARVALAAGRERDLPPPLARVDRQGVPAIATACVVAGIALLIVVGTVPHAWSLAAAAVLVYYAITNIAAMRVGEGRFIARSVSTLGLTGCVSLAAFIEPIVLGVVLGLLTIGFGVRFASHKLQPPPVPSPGSAAGSSTGSLAGSP